MSWELKNPRDWVSSTEEIASSISYFEQFNYGLQKEEHLCELGFFFASFLFFISACLDYIMITLLWAVGTEDI